MRYTNVQELHDKTAEILKQSENNTVIITENGKPKAVLTALTEEDLIDYQLENSPEFIAELNEAQKEYETKGGISLEEFLKSERFENKDMFKPEGLT